MTQISTRLPDEIVSALDVAAQRLHRTRADIVRQAIERYLEDYEDLTDSLTRLQDPSDPVLDWDELKRELLDKD